MYLPRIEGTMKRMPKVRGSVSGRISVSAADPNLRYFNGPDLRGKAAIPIC